MHVWHAPIHDPPTYLEVLEGLLLLAEKEPDGARGAVAVLGRHLEEVTLAREDGRCYFWKLLECCESIPFLISIFL